MNLPLRTLDTKNRDEYSEMLMQNVASKLDCEMTISRDANFATCRIIGEASSKIIQFFNKSIIPTLNNYIENVMESDPAYYNRSLILFETEVTNDGVIVRWAV